MTLSSKYKLWITLPLAGSLLIGVFLGVLLAVTQIYILIIGAYFHS